MCPDEGRRGLADPLDSACGAANRLDSVRRAGRSGASVSKLLRIGAARGPSTVPAVGGAFERHLETPGVTSC